MARPKLEDDIDRLPPKSAGSKTPSAAYFQLYTEMKANVDKLDREIQKKNEEIMNLRVEKLELKTEISTLKLTFEMNQKPSVFEKLIENHGDKLIKFGDKMIQGINGNNSNSMIFENEDVEYLKLNDSNFHRNMKNIAKVLLYDKNSYDSYMNQVDIMIKNSENQSNE